MYIHGLNRRQACAKIVAKPKQIVAAAQESRRRAKQYSFIFLHFLYSELTAHSMLLPNLDICNRFLSERSIFRVIASTRSQEMHVFLSDS